ncbi:MAG: DUF6785 family protein [Candidatus Latescibacterota bacterium]|nr:DUF6785 family protein [Candidatus Latescibacterota bacterium]
MSQVPHDHPPSPLIRSGLTLRALVLGLFVVILICMGAPTSIWMVGSSEITWSFFPIGVGLPFVLIVLGNSLVKRWRRTSALVAPELITIVTMGLVVSGIPIFMCGFWLAIISKPYYGATPENQWQFTIQPYLPDWAIPRTDNDAMRLFYEGLPQGGSVPWGAWLGPLSWWLSLILAVYFLCFCIVVLMRRQWMDNERLVFPLTEVPRLLTEEDPDSSLPPILRSRTFWVGCSVPLIVILFNCISYWEPGFPQLAVHQAYNLQLFQGVAPLILMIYFPIIGFVFLIGTPISFSIWFFHLLAIAGTALVNWVGFTVEPVSFQYSPYTQLSWLAGGALIAMVLWSFWMARDHLAALYRTVMRGSGELDDRQEMMPYRMAVWGGVVALIYILGWLWRLGMELHVACLLVFCAMVVYIAMTRIVIQSGVHYVTATLSPQAMTLAATGSAINPFSIVALSLSYSWCSDIQSIFMPAAAHGSRLNMLGNEHRRLGLAMAIAVLVGFVVTIWYLITICYQEGAGNFRSWTFNPGAGAGGLAFDQATRLLSDPQGPDAGKLGMVAAGAILYSVLSFCQYRFYWWPLHPVGLTIATLWNVRLIVTSVFVAWAVKSLILRIGGISAYRQARPFFIGLIVGFFLGVGVSYAIDAIWFFGKGHAILHG